MLPSFYIHNQYTRTQNGRIMTNVLILGIILIIGLFYLIQINNLVRDDYKLREARKELQAIQEENKKMQLDISQAQSLPHLQEAVADFGLVAVGEITYLESGAPKVVAGQFP